MENLAKKIGIFIALMILLIALSNVILRFALPVKTVRLNSDSMSPTYNRYDVLFYSLSDTYKVSDVIMYKPQKLEQWVTVRIIEENHDGTFKVKGDGNAAPILTLDQENLRKEQIKGKVDFSINPFIFYTLLYGIEIIIALLLTRTVYARLKNSS